MIVIKSLSFAFSLVLALSCLYATDCSLNENKLIDQADTQELWRKINISQFLYNLAATIHNVGQAATAETPRDKQRAAFGIVTSLLNLAADATVKKEKNQNDELPYDADKQVVETRTVDLVVQILDLLDVPDMRSASDHELVLNEVRAIASSPARRQFIEEKLRTEQGRSVLMSASFDLLKKSVEKRVLLVAQSLHNTDLRACEIDDFEQGFDEFCQQQPAPDSTHWWDKIVTLTTENSLVIVLHQGFQDVYNYIHNFFTKPSDTASDNE